MKRVLDIDFLAQSFSDAAVGAASWQSSLDAICESTGFAGAAITPLRGNFGRVPTNLSFSEAAACYFKNGWHKQDVRFNGLPTLRRTGLVTDFDCLPEAEMERSPYYQEWLAPFRLKWFSGVYIAGFEEEWVLSLQKLEVDGPFDQDQCALLRILSKSLSSCAVLANALEFSKADGALDAFTLSGKAVVMLNRHGEVVRTNAAAERLFDDKLRVRDRRLVCADKASARMLDFAVQQACVNAKESFNAPILLSRADQGPVIAFVSPARGIARDVLSPCQAYVILVDPYQRRASSMLLLQNLFGLTRSEAVLADRLGRGEKLRDLAVPMGIGYETARTHLRSIFSKVNVNNQADLTAMLLQLEIGDS